MGGSRFSFVSDPVLRTNLDRSFEFIGVLLTLSTSRGYSDIIKSSLCKTIIIHTASIIEALLLLILRSSRSEHDLHKWENSKSPLYQAKEDEKVCLAKRKHYTFKELNLGQVAKYCFDYKIIPRDLFISVNKVRVLRNKQHLGALEEIEQQYTKKEVDEVFAVAKEVIVCAEKLLGFF